MPKITRLEIFMGMLGRNKGHSIKNHERYEPDKKGYFKNCYRCELLHEIFREEQMLMAMGLEQDETTNNGEQK